MATTINVDTNGTLKGPGGAWLDVVEGGTTTASYVQAKEGALEWAEAPTATPPAVTFVGHDIRDDEQQVLEALAAGQSYYIRTLEPGGFVRAIITPGTAAA